MKRLINLTTILSMALYVVPPFAAQAQDLKTVTVDGKEVICLPNKKAECPEGKFCVIALKPANCEQNAVKALADAAAKAAIDAAAGIDATAGVTADVTVAPDVTVQLDAAAQAEADAKAAADAAAATAAAEKAAADLAAKKQAKADAKAKKQAEAKAAADAQAAADAKATADAQAAADAKAAADAQAAADTKAAADAQAAADTKAAADAQAAADAKAAADAAVTAQADATVATTDPASGFKTVKVKDQNVICLPNKKAVCPQGALCVVAVAPAKCKANATKMLNHLAQTGADAPDPAVIAAAQAEDAAAVAAAQAAAAEAAAAAAADPNLTPVEAPVPTIDAVTTLETVLDTPVASDATTETTVEAAAGAGTTTATDGTLPADQPPAAGAIVTTETLSANDTRDSAQEFAAAPVTVAPGKKSGLSDFEKVGLVALGALVIGAIINGNKQVVENTGDRVVVRQPDGTYQVYKDDNALLREPGSTVRTETYNDGSTRSIVTRTDGSQIVTIRDASGRVLQRVAYDRTGHPTVLIDDLQPEQPVVVTELPRVQPRANQISLDQSDAELRAQLAAANAAYDGRRFSLRQIRNIPQVRYLAPTIDVNNITFESGSAAIQPTEARKLANLGRLITQMIKVRPGEVFLIEGHTDAVGSGASNLSLSDRRAESVAKALTEYFGVPPENLVVQGYGESELKIDTLGDERLNRRVAVRVITPILRQSAI